MIRDRTVAVLIDFDNFYPQAHQYNNLDFLVHEFNRIIEEALTLDSKTEHMIIRLYGGWMEQGLWTRSASLLQQEISRTNFFPLSDPKSGRILHGDITLAISLLSLPLLVWQSTRRKRNGLPRMRLDQTKVSDTCNDNAERCPIRILEKFSRRSGKICAVPKCGVSNSDAFTLVEQKMVDTILCCDILYLSGQADISSLIIMSDDLDIYPPAAQACEQFGKPIVLIHRSQARSSETLAFPNLTIKQISGGFENGP